MKKEELLSALSKIEPDNELKDQTKLKMMQLAMTRESSQRKSPKSFAKRMPAAICALALMFVCVSALGVEKFSPNAYIAEVGLNDGVSNIEHNAVPSRILETEAQAIEKENAFDAFLASLTEDYRAIGVKGRVISQKVYAIENTDEYGIYGFAIISVKVSDVFFSENEPFFGIKENDTVSFVRYLNSDSDVVSLSGKGSEVKFFAYSGKDLTPIDETSGKLGLENVFVIFN